MWSQRDRVGKIRKQAHNLTKIMGKFKQVFRMLYQNKNKSLNTHKTEWRCPGSLSGDCKASNQLFFPGGTNGIEPTQPMWETWGAGLIPGSGRSWRRAPATHFGILAWRIQWPEEFGGLQSIESQSPTRLKQLSSSNQLLHALFFNSS